MKILIISKLFYPQNSIGAIRPTNIAKYLADLGHDVIVFTGGANFLNDVNFKVSNIIRISYKSILKIKKESNNNKASHNIISTNIKWLALKRLIIDWIDNYSWFVSCKRYIKINCKKNDFDIVISSYGPIGSYWIGRYVKKCHFAKKWICDFRDQLENEVYYWWINFIMKQILIQAIETSDKITVVSKGQLDSFKISLNKHFRSDKMQVIYSGYDNNLMTNNKIDSSNTKFTLCYVGSLYFGKRDMSPLFASIKECIDDKIFTKGEIEILYAGSDRDIIYRQAHSYDLKSICRCYGFIDREESLLLQHKSDVLIVLSWNTRREQGILTGKFLEYLHAQKPILAIISGDVPNAELTELIIKMNVGLSYEEANASKDKLKLKEFIISGVFSYRNKVQLPFSPLQEEVEKFDYKNIIKKVDSICQTI